MEHWWVDGMVGAPEGLLTVLFRFVLIVLAIVVPRNAVAMNFRGVPGQVRRPPNGPRSRVWLPQSKTRVASAKAALAQQAFFNGKGLFEVVFPIQQANLDDPLVIRGLLAMLDERGEARAIAAAACARCG